MRREAFQTVREGMVAASRTGTAWATFAELPDHRRLQDGHPERGQTGGYNSVFIAYAPAEDPEIAVAVVVEKGWEGTTRSRRWRATSSTPFLLSRTGGSSTNYGEPLP